MAIKYHSPIKGINEDIAELFGLHAGDGWLYRNQWGITCNSSDENLIGRICDLSRRVLGIEPTLSYNQSSHGVRIRSGQRQVIDYFKKCFPVGKKAYTVRMPNDIMKSEDVRVIKGALRGLFSSDGCFSFRKKDLYPYIRFTSRSKDLIDQFVELASRLGYIFRIYSQQRNGVIYTANLREKQVIKWMSEVGTACDAHIKRFEVWKIEAGVPETGKRAGLKILWRRPSWVQIPPPAL